MKVEDANTIKTIEESRSMKVVEDANTIKTIGAFLVMVVGLVVIALVVMKIPISAEGWKPSDVTTIVGSLTTFLGSVVGAFLGVQVGAAGKDKAEAARAKAEDTAKKALAALPPGDAERIARE